MAFILVNRVRVNTATTGTGTVTLGAAATGFQTFAGGGVSDADTTRYLITEGANWEIGTGTYTASGTTMARSVEESSNADALINLGGAAIVEIIAAETDIVQPNKTQTLTEKTITDLILEGAVDEEEFTITDAADFVIDPTNGSLQKITLGASRTPAAAPAGWTEGKGILLKIDDGTAFSITWTTLGVVWVGGTAPTLATTGWTVVALWQDADDIYGKLVGDVA